MVIPVVYVGLPGYGLLKKVLFMTKKSDLPTADTLIDEINSFRQQQKTLQLATCYKNHEPLASYAPFVEDEAGNFYLLLSGLAAHSTNLQWHQSVQNPISVLLIEDEQTARNLFARRRLTYSCTVAIWSREHPQWQPIIEQLQTKFGNTIEVLSSLGDFKLYCLTPMQGNYVRGFGQAFELKEAKHPII